MAQSYTVLSPVDHDWMRYEEGQSVALPEDAAAALLAVGVIEQAEARKPKQPGAADAVR
jgi:hypothetical protein